MDPTIGFVSLEKILTNNNGINAMKQCRRNFQI